MLFFHILFFCLSFFISAPMASAEENQTEKLPPIDFSQPAPVKKNTVAIQPKAATPQEQSTKAAWKESGHATAQAFKETGHSIRHAAHQTNTAFKETWHNTKDTTKNAWDKTADTGKDIGSTVSDASKDIWHSLKNLFN